MQSKSLTRMSATTSQDSSNYNPSNKTHTMRKDIPLDFDIELDDEFMDNFGDIEDPEGEPETESMTVTPIHDDWNIVKAFNVINEFAPKSRLKKDLFIRCAEAFGYLSDTLGFNPIQCVVIAMLIEEGKPVVPSDGQDTRTYMPLHDDILQRHRGTV